MTADKPLGEWDLKSRDRLISLRDMALDLRAPELAILAIRFDPSQELWALDRGHLPPDLRGAVAKRQMEYLLGRYAAACAIEKLAGRFVIPGRDHKLAVWPPGMLGSISHKSGLVVAAVGQQTCCHGIGIDCEALLSQSRWKSIERHVATPREIMGASPTGMSELQGTLIFSIKEAIYKAIYPSYGQYFGFQAASITGIELDDGLAFWELEDTLSAEFPKGFSGRARFFLDEESSFLVSLVVI